MSRYHICLSLYGTTEEILNAIRENPQADLYEIRIDLSTAADPARIRQATKKELIFTARGQPEKLQRLSNYADYLDSGTETVKSAARRIVSFHGTEENPTELWTKLKGNHITKIALDSAMYSTLFLLTELNKNQNSVCFGMGEVASFTRLIALFKGALWIYSSPSGRPTADGQFSFRDLREIYHIQRFERPPEIFGIIGNPVSHSKSPQFHNERFAAESRNWIYLPFLCKDLKSLLEYAPKFGISGFSVTHPFKEEALNMLSAVPSELGAIGSCNTLCWKVGRWHGANTDVDGVRATLQELSISLPDSRIVILGAGGSARAIASVVGKIARETIILNRHVENAQTIAKRFGGRSGILEDFGRFDYDVLFQATPVGLNQQECPVDPRLLKPARKVVDLIYEPKETLLLQKAREIGCQILNGEVWFRAQAEAQYAWWKKMLERKE